MSEHTPGDKVRIRNGKLSGERGILIRPRSDKWIVAVPQKKRRTLVYPSDMINYSSAARRAWKSMPDRKVGRPLGSKVTDRISVIFRIDRKLWRKFLAAEQQGLIQDRTTTINECLHRVITERKLPSAKAS